MGGREEGGLAFNGHACKYERAAESRKSRCAIGSRISRRYYCPRSPSSPSSSYPPPPVVGRDHKKERSGRGIVRENKSRALSIRVRHAAGRPAGRVPIGARSCAPRGVGWYASGTVIKKKNRAHEMGRILLVVPRPIPGARSRALYTCGLANSGRFEFIFVRGQAALSMRVGLAVLGVSAVVITPGRRGTVREKSEACYTAEESAERN